MYPYNVDGRDIQAQQFPGDRRKWLRCIVDKDVYVHNCIT